MAIIKTLKFKTSVDTIGFKSAVSSMMGDASKISSQIQGKMSAIKPVTTSIIGGFQGIGASALAVGGALAVVEAGAAALRLGFEAASTAIHAGFDFIKVGIRDAIDLNETISKIDIVLGDASKGVKDFANDLGREFGIVKGEVLDLASSIGGLGKGLGKLQGPKLEEFTKQFTMMTLDLQAFANIKDMKEAGAAIRIGLSGNESDKLKELGVIYNEGAIKAYALEHGIKKVNGEFTQQQKLMIRAALITQGLADAHGNLALTAGETAAQERKLSGTLKNLGADIGKVLLPVYDKGIKIVGGIVSYLASGFERSKVFIDSAVEFVTLGIERVRLAIDYVRPAFEQIATTGFGALLDIGRAVYSVLPSFDAIINVVNLVAVTSANVFQGVVDTIRVIPASIGAAFGDESLSGVWKLRDGIGTFLVDAISTAAFTIRNFGDLFGVVQLKIGQEVAYVIDTIALIPTNLGLIADYVKGNWVEIMMLPFKNLRNLVAELAKTIQGLFEGKGFHFDTDAVLKDFKALQSKLPELAKAKPLDISAGIDERIDSIAKREEAFRAQLAKPFASADVTIPKAQAIVPNAIKPIAPTQMASQSKAVEVKLAGAAELGTKDFYSSYARAQTGAGSYSKVEKHAKDTADNTAGMAKTLTRIERNTAPANGPKAKKVVF